ncbi:MAG: cellulase family glycosylhydrolase [Saprospiraceae bacterium]|nr:cellulase family glycosylhydrolase [Saprospiraceae bacterium]
MKASVLIIFLPFILGIKLGVSQSFVVVQDGQFFLEGSPYYFIGTNLWYGMHLGAPQSGNQQRLLRELDHLKSIGVNNLRIMACSEGPADSPWRVSPALQNSPGIYSDDLWQGLDFLLYEMSKREMKGVLCLTNFWPWSGGMSQYVSWSEGSQIPYPPPQKDGSWLKYQLYTSRFYVDNRAKTYYLNHVDKVLNRTNHCTGIAYRSDPTIMAWQLANEPRGILRSKKYRQWIDETAGFIKKIDRHHLLTIGSEGNTSSSWSGNRFFPDHQFNEIDYCTIHFWAENWGWYDPANPEVSYPNALKKMREYLDNHLKIASQLGKPLVFEEFGLARDQGSFNLQSMVKYRDEFYRHIFESFIQGINESSALCGVNFWAWSGEGRPVSEGDYWKAGHEPLGDPPHERQGWYGVYDQDSSTLRMITEFTSRLK